MSFNAAGPATPDARPMRRFLEQCRIMQAHVAQLGTAGKMWATQSERIIAQAGAHRNDGFFSSHLFLMDSFGAGPLAPDGDLLQGSVVDRALRRYGRVVRGRLGYGRFGDLALGPASMTELTVHALRSARAMYANAVAAAYGLLREPIERWDVRSGAIFSEQRTLVAGRELAWQTLVALKRVLVIRERIGTCPVMLEIGSGTGEFARLMLATGSAERCVLVDIPPALAFAQELISEHFAGTGVELFSPARGPIGEEVLERSRCILLTPDQLPLVPRADLVVNAASFGEMSQRAVREYAAQLKRMRPRSIVSINARRPHPLNAAEGIGSEFYESVFGPEYVVDARYEWTKTLETDLRPTPPGHSGYEWMSFRPA